jgi:single-strand DNA-binding protein
MSNGIQLDFVGNLTREPEIRFTTGGRAVTSCGVAVTRRYQQNGEWQEQTTFLDLVIWGLLGENVASSLAKGSRVVGTGRLEQRSWETDSGEKRSKWECIVDEIGPSLRWATADVRKIERTTEGGYTPPPTPTSGGGGGQGYDNPAYAGEEPFIRDATERDL